MFTKEDINVRHAPVWVPVETSMHGEVDKVQKDYVIRVPLRLWGAWTAADLTVLFPSAVLTPIQGTRLYGTSDLPLVIHGSNQDRTTYHNAQLTKLSNLFLGVNAPLFAADVEFTCLLKNNTAPTDAAAYYTHDTTAYADTTFAKTNFRQQAYACTWGAVTGFVGFQAKLGWNVEWTLDLEPEIVDGVGTVDMILQNFLGRARCIPLEPRMFVAGVPDTFPISAAAKFQGAGGGLGHMLSASVADLTITGTNVSVVLKNAGMTELGYAWGMKPLRNGELAWETTTAFTTGVAAARAVITAPA